MLLTTRAGWARTFRPIGTAGAAIVTWRAISRRRAAGVLSDKTERWSSKDQRH